MASAAVQEGRGRDAKRWQLAEHNGYIAGNDKRWPELQLCDLLSNASYRDFRRCDATARATLSSAFGVFDVTLKRKPASRRIDELLGRGSFGLALVVLLDIVRSEQRLEKDVDVELRRLIGALADLPPRARDSHLRFGTEWLKDIVDRERSLEDGKRVAAWLISGLLVPMEKDLERDGRASELLWARLAIEMTSLVASNHDGDLRGAAERTQRINGLLPAIAQRFEHADLILEALVHQAVHLIDAYVPEEAATRAKAASTYFEEISSLLSDALPEVFPERVRSELRGRALGTWLQAEIVASAGRADRLSGARRLSELALDEFTAPADVARQHQYRSQLEALAGEHATARAHLAASLGLNSSTHEALAQGIAGMPEGFGQGFALLHWSRIGALSRLGGNVQEAEAFLDALEGKELRSLSWCNGGRREYPAHGILRRLAVVRVGAGDLVGARTSVRQLRQLSEAQAPRLPLLAVELAALVEVAALTPEADARTAARLLDCTTPQEFGARQVLERMLGCSDATTGVREVFEPWLPAIHAAKDALSARAPGPMAGLRAELLALSRRVPH